MNDDQRGSFSDLPPHDPSVVTAAGTPISDAATSGSELPLGRIVGVVIACCVGYLILSTVLGGLGRLFAGPAEQPSEEEAAVEMQNPRFDNTALLKARLVERDAFIRKTPHLVKHALPHCFHELGSLTFQAPITFFREFDRARLEHCFIQMQKASMKPGEVRIFDEPVSGFNSYCLMIRSPPSNLPSFGKIGTADLDNIRYARYLEEAVEAMWTDYYQMVRRYDAITYIFTLRSSPKPGHYLIRDINGDGALTPEWPEDYQTVWNSVDSDASSH